MQRSRDHLLDSRAGTREPDAGAGVPGALGRVWFGATAAAALIGIALIVSASVRASAGSSDAIARAAHVFSFWTTLSNLIVAITYVLLAVDPRRTATLFWTFHLLGLSAVIITGVVSNTLLPRVAPPFTGMLGVGVDLVHIVVPIMAVLGWLLFGPGGRYSARLIPLASLFPPIYGVVTLLRGAIIGFYPYPFLEVGTLGYARVFGNMLGLLVVFVVLAGGLVWLDRARLRRQPLVRYG